MCDACKHVERERGKRMEMEQESEGEEKMVRKERQSEEER